LRDKKNADGAITAYKKALELNAGETGAQEGLCKAYWMKKDVGQATACYQEFVKQHPENEAARKNYFHSAQRLRQADVISSSV
jgi:tetratricopeptide (TPR) repeat protein